MTARTAPPTAIAGRAATLAVGTWDRLAARPPADRVFDASMTEGLPEPSRRWLTHAIAPGTPLASAVVLEMRGQIRIGRWLTFHAIQLHAPPEGYVWAAKVSLGPLSISGFDRYADGHGEMRWRLLGRVPVMSATGTDLDRSAAGRIALDALFVPTASLSAGVVWQSRREADTAVAGWSMGNEALPVDLTVGPDGALRSVRMLRWGNPGRRPWGQYPFGGTIESEGTFGGVTIPTRVRAGWFFGTPDWDKGEFFRATITSATFI